MGSALAELPEEDAPSAAALIRFICRHFEAGQSTALIRGYTNGLSRAEKKVDHELSGTLVSLFERSPVEAVEIIGAAGSSLTLDELERFVALVGDAPRPENRVNAPKIELLLTYVRSLAPAKTTDEDRGRLADMVLNGPVDPQSASGIAYAIGTLLHDAENQRSVVGEPAGESERWTLSEAQAQRLAAVLEQADSRVVDAHLFEMVWPAVLNIAPATLAKLGLRSVIEDRAQFHHAVEDMLQAVAAHASEALLNSLPMQSELQLRCLREVRQLALLEQVPRGELWNWIHRDKLSRTLLIATYLPYPELPPIDPSGERSKKRDQYPYVPPVTRAFLDRYGTEIEVRNRWLDTHFEVYSWFGYPVNEYRVRAEAAATLLDDETPGISDWAMIAKSENESRANTIERERDDGDADWQRRVSE